MAAPAPLSPLAPKKYPALPVIEGVRFASVAAGVRYAGRTDVTMALFDAPAAVAGVFTRSKCPSAPVDWCRDNLPRGMARARRRQFRQRQRLHRRTRRGAVDEVAAARRQGDRRRRRTRSSWPRPA